MNDPASDLSLHNVSIAYGRQSVLQDISLRVQPGSTYALLGRNGTGKSSLLRSVLGHRPQRGGQIRLLGKDPWKKRRSLMNDIGVVPETPDAPPRMTINQLLRFCERLYPRWARPEAESRLERFSISQRTRFGKLSRGQKTQVHLTLALGHHPKLLILDDPTLGLDVVARKALFEELVSEMAERKPTVLIATHDFAGVEKLAERVGILHAGRLVVDENIEALKKRYKKISFPSKVDSDQVLRELEALQPISVERNGWGTEAVVAAEAPRFASAQEEPPAGSQGAALSLEDIFVAITGPGGRT